MILGLYSGFNSGNISLCSIVFEMNGVLSAGDCVTYTILLRCQMNVEFLEVSPDVVSFGLRGHVLAQVEFVGLNDIPVNLHLVVLM